jgi:hypothetical protein
MTLIFLKTVCRTDKEHLSECRALLDAAGISSLVDVEDHQQIRWPPQPEDRVIYSVRVTLELYPAACRVLSLEVRE